MCRREILDSIGCLKEVCIIRKLLTVTLLFTKLFSNKGAQKELKKKKMHEITFFVRKLGCVRSWMRQQKRLKRPYMKDALFALSSFLPGF